MLYSLLLIIGFLQCVLIKHKSEDKYLRTFDEAGKTFFTLTSNVNEAVDLNISLFKDGLVFVRDAKEADKVFDIADNNVELIFYKYHGGRNQQFYITLIGPGIYNIKNVGNCLTYDSISTKILLNSCNNSESQVFEVVEPEEKNSISNPKNYEYMRYKLLNRDADPLYEFSEKSGLRGSLNERLYPEEGDVYPKPKYYPQEPREKNNSWSYSSVRYYPEARSYPEQQQQQQSKPRLSQEPLFFDSHYHHHSRSKKNNNFNDY